MNNKGHKGEVATRLFSHFSQLVHCRPSYLSDFVQSATRLVRPVSAQMQTSAPGVRRGWCRIQTHCCVAWQVTQTARRGRTFTMTSSPAWAATGTATRARGRAAVNARPVRSPNSFIVSVFHQLPSRRTPRPEVLSTSLCSWCPRYTFKWLHNDRQKVCKSLLEILQIKITYANRQNSCKCK